MTTIQAIILGLLQGITEFLPVSSSGHLLIAGAILDMPHHAGLPTTELVAHLGTLLAVFLVFGERLTALLRRGLSLLSRGTGARQWREALWDDPEGWMISAVALGSIPTALMYLGFKDFLEQAFQTPRWAGAGLLATSGLLVVAHWRRNQAGASERLGFWGTVAVGVAQGAALLPGVSRAGATIIVALLLGMKPSKAFEFSFLLSIPAILGANLLSLTEISNGSHSFGVLATLFCVSFVSGLAALLGLRGIIERRRLGLFAIYCFPVGLWALLWL